MWSLQSPPAKAANAWEKVPMCFECKMVRLALSESQGARKKIVGSMESRRDAPSPTTESDVTHDVAMNSRKPIFYLQSPERPTRREQEVMLRGHGRNNEPLSNQENRERWRVAVGSRQQQETGL